MGFVSEPLSEQHDLRFDSGRPELDTWLQRHALASEARRTGRTFVWLHDERVVAYYTVTGHLLARAERPRGNPTEVPAVMLARLALDKGLHGQGHGGVLLADALHRIVAATQTVAARFVLVDAIDEVAHAFYRCYGFREIPGTLRLVQKISDVAAALDAA
ncbi:GNAT family N-acetyltransferase [Virgisporangium aurantiacum]|uniref:N-acetyltransferase GCN5 n=1 Tax=Virgisporangium aurantiacum TaxID=175570 RepID=A0A8J3Z7J0_9ACTN|nr:GNAT family N-acetyltransferase [Virgisporangium aurantiacum]GIJ58831.1 N-acetyltransferase GCN5 [Virgisporangium aurantiacum]